MQGLVTYNKGSILDCMDGLLNPGQSIVSFDHMAIIGATTETATEWITRLEAASGGGAAVTAATAAGEFGLVAITPNSTAGGRICMATMLGFPNSTSPLIIECKAKITASGSYFIGWAEGLAAEAAVITSGAMATNVYGAGMAIQTDDKADIISTATSHAVNTAVTDCVTLTAGTYYRLGVKVWTNKCEIYVDGRKVGTQNFAANITEPCTPTIVAKTNGKVITIDWVGIAV